MRLVYVRSDFTKHALALFLMAALVAVLVIAVFDWDIGDVAIWTVVGAAVWGTAAFFTEVRRQLPNGRLPNAPDGVHVNGSRGRDGWLSRLSLVLFAIASCVGLAWLADRWALGPVFAPGQFVGYACAAALGAVLVARWERATGRRVVMDCSAEDDEFNLYAVRCEGGLDG